AGKHDVVAWGQESKDKVGGLFGVEAALATLDVGKEITGEVRCQFTNEEAARKGAKALHATCDMFRGQLILACAAREFDQLSPQGSGDAKEFRFVPLKLFRQIEKDLQQAHVRSEGTVAILTMSVGVDGQTLRTEIEAAVRRAGGKGWLGGITWPFPLPGRNQLGPGDPGPPRQVPAKGDPNQEGKEGSFGPDEKQNTARLNELAAQGWTWAGPTNHGTVVFQRRTATAAQPAGKAWEWLAVAMGPYQKGNAERLNELQATGWTYVGPDG